MEGRKEGKSIRRDESASAMSSFTQDLAYKNRHSFFTLLDCFMHEQTYVGMYVLFTYSMHCHEHLLTVAFFTEHLSFFAISVTDDSG